MYRPLLQLLFVVALAYGAWLAFNRVKALLDDRRAALKGHPRRRGLTGSDLPFDVIDGGDGEPTSGGQVISLHDDPYTLLGVAPDADDGEVEAAYRRLLEQNSPEKVAGLSDEIQQTAARMTRRIEQAYAEVQRRRGQ